MSTDELKILLHESINQIDDVELLEGLREIIEANKNSEKNIVLPEWQRKIIDESKQQIARGEFRTHEEVFKSIDEWLEKQFGRNVLRMI